MFDMIKMFIMTNKDLSEKFSKSFFLFFIIFFYYIFLLYFFIIYVITMDKIFLYVFPNH
jgi:hypothetical protein